MTKTVVDKVDTLISALGALMDEPKLSPIMLVSLAGMAVELQAMLQADAGLHGVSGQLIIEFMRSMRERQSALLATMSPAARALVQQESEKVH